jgi:hypothetical protein
MPRRALIIAAGYPMHVENVVCPLFRERFCWSLLTLQAIVVPITVSRTSNLLRAIETLFEVDIAFRRYYSFMASVKLPWDALWETLWWAIPSPLVDGRLVLALDDSINANG